MSCITIDSGTGGGADTRNDGAERPGLVTILLGAVLGVVSACRSAGALAMMSERELDDLGLLPWEVRSEIDGGAKGRGAAWRPDTPAHCCCNQA